MHGKMKFEKNGMCKHHGNSMEFDLKLLSGCRYYKKIFSLTWLACFFSFLGVSAQHDCNISEGVVKSQLTAIQWMFADSMALGGIPLE